MDEVFNLREWLTSIRSICEDVDETKRKQAIPYGDDDEIMKSATESARTLFGADFSGLKTPMLYYPDDKDVTLSGVIPGLNNAKFQFRLLGQPESGCYIWVDSIQLTEPTLRTLNTIFGVYRNWQHELSTTRDREPISYRSGNNVSGDNETTETNEN